MTSVLVTGGAGFIGSNLVDRLLTDGHHVTVVDDFSTGKSGNLDAARQRAGDALAVHRLDLVEDDIDGLVAAARPTIIHHLAAQIDVRASVDDPVRDAMVNVVGTVRLLEAARRHEVAKIVLATSGGCIYGEPPADALPIGESYAGHPHSPYGASKRGVEEYLHCYEALYGLRWTSLALANVYGPRQDPGGEAGVVSIFGGRMLDGQPVTVFGDGHQTRDFVFVADVVDAFARVMGSGDGLRCNIGTGMETSVNALFAAIATEIGYERPPVSAPARVGELERIAVDPGLAAKALDWEPRTNLSTGIAATVDWLRAGRA